MLKEHGDCKVVGGREMIGIFFGYACNLGGVVQDVIGG